MAQITCERISPKLVKVTRAGDFIGYLERGARKSAGLRGETYSYWSGIISGRLITATTIASAKEKMNAA